MRRGNKRLAGIIFTLLSIFTVSAVFTLPVSAAGNPPQESFGVAGYLAAAFGIAFVIALIVTGIMKGQLKTVYRQPAADNYIKQGSMQLTKKSDLFLYRQVERRKREEDDSSDDAKTQTSSSVAARAAKRGKR